MKGMFITFEGPDGSGKTTVAKMIYDRLLQDGYPVILTREPGGIDIAEQIRDVIHNIENTAMDSKTETLLYAASRRQHLIEKIKPALEDGKIVLCDRFVDSSLVYQGIGRGLGIEEVFAINTFAIEDIMPDLTIMFDIMPKVGLERINKNKDREVNRLDLEDLSFHELTYTGYMKVADMFKNRIVKTDASLSIEQVFDNVYLIVKQKLCENN